MLSGLLSSSGDTAELAFTDPLTGLGNQRRFFDKIERLIRERADDPAPFAVVHPRSRRVQADQRSVRPARRRRHPAAGRHAPARLDGPAFHGDARRRRRIRLPLPDDLQRGGDRRARPHADRDPVRALRCRRADRAPFGIRRLLAVPFRRRNGRLADLQGGDGALPRQALGTRRRRRLHARDGGGGQARHPHRTGAAPRRVGRRGGALFPADRRPDRPARGRLRDAGALARPRSRPRARRPPSSPSPRSAASSARCRNWC